MQKIGYNPELTVKLNNLDFESSPLGFQLSSLSEPDDERFTVTISSSSLETDEESLPSLVISQ